MPVNKKTDIYSNVLFTIFYFTSGAGDGVLSSSQETVSTVAGEDRDADAAPGRSAGGGGGGGMCK